MALLLRKFIRPVAISVAVALLTAFAALTVSYLLFPVTGIEVTGARMFPESEAWEAFPEHASLLLLNLDALERRIESNPWVKGAKVFKDWESGIVTVEVEERRPMFYGDLGGRRIVYSADGTELPGLGGVDLKRLTIDDEQLEEILRIGEVLEKNGVPLDSIDGVDANGVEATVEGHSVLCAGNIGGRQARALKGLINEHPNTPYFDLRSPERVVIGEESETGE